MCSGRLGSSTGVVSMADIAKTDTTNAQLMIVDGTFGYIITDTTISRITDDGFVNKPETVTSQDSYFLVNYNNSNYVGISDVGDGTSWDATQDFAAGGYSDNTLAIISDHRDVFAFGEKTWQWLRTGRRRKTTAGCQKSRIEKGAGHH